MCAFQSLIITLPVELADMLKAKIAAGEYASESEVVIDGLHALMDKDAATERWLHDKVAPAYDAHKADPGRIEPLTDAITILRARIVANRCSSGDVATLRAEWQEGKASGSSTDVDFDTLKDEVHKELAAAKRRDC